MAKNDVVRATENMCRVYQSEAAMCYRKASFVASQPGYSRQIVVGHQLEARDFYELAWTRLARLIGVE